MQNTFDNVIAEIMLRLINTGMHKRSLTGLESGNILVESKFTFESDSNNPTSPIPDYQPTFFSKARTGAAHATVSNQPDPARELRPGSSVDDRRGWEALGDIFDRSAMEEPSLIASAGVLLGSQRSSASHAPPALLWPSASSAAAAKRYEATAARGPVQSRSLPAEGIGDPASGAREPARGGGSPRSWDFADREGAGGARLDYSRSVSPPSQDAAAGGGGGGEQARRPPPAGGAPGFTAPPNAPAAAPGRPGRGNASRLDNWVQTAGAGRQPASEGGEGGPACRGGPGGGRGADGA